MRAARSVRICKRVAPPAFAAVILPAYFVAGAFVKQNMELVLHQRWHSDGEFVVLTIKEGSQSPLAERGEMTVSRRPSAKSQLIERALAAGDIQPGPRCVTSCPSEMPFVTVVAFAGSSTGPMQSTALPAVLVLVTGFHLVRSTRP